jgi:hypothetical protein
VLAGEPAVLADADAARYVAKAIYIMSFSPDGLAACLDAGARNSLAALALAPAIAADADASEWVAKALDQLDEDAG